MNKIYRTVYNRTLGTVQVVSELSKAVTKSKVNKSMVTALGVVLSVASVSANSIQSPIANNTQILNTTSIQSVGSITIGEYGVITVDGSDSVLVINEGETSAALGGNKICGTDENQYICSGQVVLQNGAGLINYGTVSGVDAPSSIYNGGWIQNHGKIQGVRGGTHSIMSWDGGLDFEISALSDMQVYVIAYGHDNVFGLMGNNQALSGIFDTDKIKDQYIERFTNNHWEQPNDNEAGEGYYGFSKFEVNDGSVWNLTGDTTLDWHINNGHLTGNIELFDKIYLSVVDPDSTLNITSSIQRAVEAPPHSKVTLLLNQDSTFNGNIYGMGDVEFKGEGDTYSLSFGDDVFNDFVGNLNLINIKLNAMVNATLNGLNGNQDSVIEIDQSLTVNTNDPNSPTSIFDGVLTGNGDFIKNGSGTLILNGDNTYTGQTRVNAGKLVVNGINSSSDYLVDNASFGGAGQIKSLTVTNNGAIDLHNGSAETLTVLDDVEFDNGITYLVDVNTQGQSDLVKTTKAVLLQMGSSIIIEAYGADSDKLVDYNYAVIEAEAGITGQFGTVSVINPFYDAELDYSDPTKVIVKLIELSKPKMSYTQYAVNGNQMSVARSLDELYAHLLTSSRATRSMPQNILTAVSSAVNQSQALDMLSGEMHGSVLSVLNDSVTRLISTPMKNLRDNLELTKNNQTTNPIWVSIEGNKGSLDNTNNAAEVDYDSINLIIGGDTEIGDGWHLGGAGAYSTGSVDVDDRNSKADTKGYTAMVFGGKSFGAVNWTSATTFTVTDVDTTRNVDIGTGASRINETLTSDYKVRNTQLFTELSYTQPLSTVSIVEPFIGLHLNHMDSDGFTESNGQASLTSDSTRSTQISSILGVRAKNSFDIGASKANVNGSLGWKHNYNETDVSRTLAFDGYSNISRFDIYGAQMDENALLVELGAGIKATTNTSFDLNYKGHFGNRSQNNSANLGMKVNF